MGKSFAIFGDSISTFDGALTPGNHWFYDASDENKTGVVRASETWWALVAAAAGARLIANASFSGSMVQGAAFPAACAPQRALQVIAPDGEAPDVIYVFMGINDYGWGSPEAQYVAGSLAAPKGVGIYGDAARGVDPAGCAPKHAAQSFGEAYATMVANLQAVAPQADVRCMTLLPGRVAGQAHNTFCYNLRGVPFDHYNDEIRKAAQATGATVIDVRALGLDYESTDGTHPNKEGMRQIAALVAAAEGDTAALAGYPAYLKSECACDLSLAQGCPHADREAKRWSCVCCD